MFSYKYFVTPRVRVCVGGRIHAPICVWFPSETVRRRPRTSLGAHTYIQTYVRGNNITHNSVPYMSYAFFCDLDDDRIRERYGLRRFTYRCCAHKPSQTWNIFMQSCTVKIDTTPFCTDEFFSPRRWWCRDGGCGESIVSVIVGVQVVCSCTPNRFG